MRLYSDLPAELTETTVRDELPPLLHSVALERSKLEPEQPIIIPRQTAAASISDTIIVTF